MTNSHDDRHKLVTQTEKDRTVSGWITVTQPISWLLNADVTQVEKDRIVTGIVTALKGKPAYTPVKKKGFYTTQQSDQPLWTPATGKKFVITDIIVSVGVAMRVYLQDDASKMWEWMFAANGGAVINLETPDESAAVNNVLSITTSAEGRCSIKVLGYEE